MCRLDGAVSVSTLRKGDRGMGSRGKKDSHPALGALSMQTRQVNGKISLWCIWTGAVNLAAKKMCSAGIEKCAIVVRGV